MGEAVEITSWGFIMGGLRSRIGAGWAVVLSSLVFALAHTLSVGGSIPPPDTSMFGAWWRSPSPATGAGPSTLKWSPTPPSI
ncbi:MAG: CPBP family glutamic-type intramembrane protease [Candidatus Dormibacteria bacterium]